MWEHVEIRGSVRGGRRLAHVSPPRVGIVGISGLRARPPCHDVPPVLDVDPCRRTAAVHGLWGMDRDCVFHVERTRPPRRGGHQRPTERRGRPMGQRHLLGARPLGRSVLEDGPGAAVPSAFHVKRVHRRHQLPTPGVGVPRRGRREGPTLSSAHPRQRRPRRAAPTPPPAARSLVSPSRAMLPRHYGSDRGTPRTRGWASSRVSREPNTPRRRPVAGPPGTPRQPLLGPSPRADRHQVGTASSPTA